MKKSIFSASVLIAGLAFAGATQVTDEYVLGVMPVATSGKSQVILSIPWVQEGGVTNVIAVTNLVKTAGLAAGDKLTWYDTDAGKYQQWQVVVRDGIGYWDPVTAVEPSDSYETPATDAALAQGQAVVLTTTASPTTLYVVGQVGANSSVTTTVSGNSWTLLAPPRGSTSEVDFNTCASDGNGWASCEEDEITTGVLNGTRKTYTCKNVGSPESPSYKWTTSVFSTSHTAMIPAGQGFWYNRKKSGSVTITWTGVPNVTE